MSSIRVGLVALVGLAVFSIGTRASLRLPSRQSSDDKPAGDKKEEKTPIQKFMRGKLTAAGNVLEGLVTEDFTLMERGASKLLKTSHSEQWQVSNDAMYRQFSQRFLRKVEQLQEAGKDEKIDAAALAHVEVTMSCVECHKWVNAVLITDAHPVQSPLERTLSEHRAVPRPTPLHLTNLTPTGAEDSPSRRFMRAKLDRTKQVLEGMLTKRYDLVEKAAEEILTMSEAAEWKSQVDKRHKEDNEEFKVNCRQLVEAAKKKSDEVAFRYLQLTLSCVNCHKHARQAKTALTRPPERAHQFARRIETLRRDSQTRAEP